MGFGRLFGHQHEKQQIDRLAVRRFKRNRLFEPQKSAYRCSQFRNAAMGNRDTLSQPRRAQPFARQQAVEHRGPRDTLVGAQASHAWAEVYLPAAGWIGFDPTNNTLADERYVKVSVGRDYEDVTPVRGNYHGTGHCRMEVNVLVEKIV